MNLLRLGGSRHVIHLLQTPVASFSLSKCQSPPNGRLCVICPLLPIQSPFPSFHPPLTPWLSHQCWNTSGLPLPQCPCTCCSFCRKCFPKYPQGFFPHHLDYSLTFAPEPTSPSFMSSSSFVPKWTFPDLFYLL